MPAVSRSSSKNSRPLKFSKKKKDDPCFQTAHSVCTFSTRSYELLFNNIYYNTQIWLFLKIFVFSHFLLFNNSYDFVLKAHSERTLDWSSHFPTKKLHGLEVECFHCMLLCSYAQVRILLRGYFCNFFFQFGVLHEGPRFDIFKSYLR